MTASPRAEPSPVVGIVLAAGAGVRLRPLTLERPKALCPVANRALVDLAMDRVRPVVAAVAVNVHHGRSAMLEHLAGRPDVHVSLEEPVALGTAGAVGQLRPWIDGRGALVVNADAWCSPDLGAFVDGWDGLRVRILLSGPGAFGPRSRVLASLLPAAAVDRLRPEPSGLYEVCWRDAAAAGLVDSVADDGPFVDCGSVASYLQANVLAVRAAGGAVVDPTAARGPDSVVAGSVVGAGARVDGEVRDTVVWPGAVVGSGEVLERVVRTPTRTVLVR